jgi:putative NADH-flavin reductase
VAEEQTMTPLLCFVLYAVVLSVSLGRAGFRWRPTTMSGTGGRHRTKLLIVGATGGTGRQLVTQALERGHTITALVRNPAALTVDHPQLTVVQGDVLSYDAVESAVRGQEAVLSALGHKRFFYPTRILSDGTRNILRAMEAHGVPRFVCETSLGIGDSAWRLGALYTFFIIPVVLPFYFWDKTRQEQLIAASKVEWVIVRPAALTDGAKRGRYRHGLKVGSFLRTVSISRADVAEFMLNQVADDTYRGTATGIGS